MRGKMRKLRAELGMVTEGACLGVGALFELLSRICVWVMPNFSTMKTDPCFFVVLGHDFNFLKIYITP